jgi:hypothetical protein
VDRAGQVEGAKTSSPTGVLAVYSIQADFLAVPAQECQIMLRME